MFQRLHHIWIIIILLIVYVSIQSYCIQQLSLNYDEGSFASYGATILKGQGNKDIVKYDSKLPITALNMLPRAVEQVMHPGLTKKSVNEDAMRGRYISLLAAVILSLIIYHWSNLLFGKKAALFSFIIYLLCPNFLAHGIFVSSDIFACLFTTLSFFFLWKFKKTNRVSDFILASVSVAFALISKFSMVHLVILFPLLLVLDYLVQKRAIPTYRLHLKTPLLYCLIFIGINWFVISAAHLFYGMFIPLNNYQFSSTTFQHLQLFFHAIGNYLPVPLPSSYIKSMDAVIYFDQLGGGVAGSLNGATYLLGSSQVHGFWYYYFVVLLFKLPISILVLLAITIVVYFKKFNIKVFAGNEMYLIIPAVYFLIYMNFFYSTQLGIRHIMIILPLLYIFIGYLLNIILAKAMRYFIYALIGYQFISVALYFPHFLPYTNEFIRDKKMAYKKIADTNICYGEGEKYLRQYLHNNPDAKYMPQKIEPGKIVMEVNEMLDLDIATAGKYNWTKYLTPVNHIHSQYLVFDVTEAAADSLKKIYH